MRIYDIPVSIEQTEGHAFITDYMINMYGVGSTKQEAVDDYKKTVAEYHADLEESEERLGENLKRHLAYLRKRQGDMGDGE